MPPMTTGMKQLLPFVRRCVPVALLVAMGWSAYGCGDTASIPNGPAVRLASLAISPGALSPAFSPTTTNYTVNVPATTTTVTVTATPEDSITTVAITGGATQSLPGPGSSKDISIVVTAQSGSQSTYIVTVNKAALAADNNLSALAVTPGALSPAFASSQQNYTVDVAATVTSVSVSATKSDPNAVLSGDVPNEGQAMILLGGPGTTTNVLITATAQDGNAKTYRIIINRAAPANNNNLSALSVDAGSLSPPFAPGTLNYSVEVPASVGEIIVTATKSDPKAVMSASGSVIAASGTPTGQTPVSPVQGALTPVAITVIAPDGSPKTYTITVFRLPR
ncbi:MAG: cadherin-like beta sandwich domain-containing protein [Nitrospira sp.]|nr:cadherin-like beta sandwich domain-containing protein [Nitrospira sp.]